VDTRFWLIPATGFVIATGLSGVTTKLALKHVPWTGIVMWTTIVYGAVSLALLATGRGELSGGLGGVFCVITGTCAALGLLLTVVTLREARVSTAVPYMAAYPLVTILLSALVLSERLSAGKILGAALVVGGLVLLAR
jgi:uncharacterized membrane protein